MTVDEAKKKWCPFMKGENGAGEAGATCVTSNCMAWRWFETHVRNDQLAQPIPNVEPGELARSTRTHGCCGLAGPWFGQMRGFERARGSDVL